MRCKFPERDLSQRLDHTICRYKGHPYYLRYLGDGSFNLFPLETVRKVTKSSMVIKASDEFLDISTPPLGYFQATQNNVFYVSRRPNRVYKQGLSLDSISGKDLKNKNVVIDPWCKSFEDMILGVYPSIEYTLNGFTGSERDKEIAISKDITLEWKHKLQLVLIHYKNEEVGFMQIGTNTVIVPNTNMGWVVSRYLSQFNWRVQ